MMEHKTLFQQKHELWLLMLFGAFSIKDEELYHTLYDFAMIEYRHLVWLGDDLLLNEESFDFDKEEIDFQARDNFALFRKIIKALEGIKDYYHDSSMYARFRDDEVYFVQRLKSLLEYGDNNAPITAFDKRREMQGYDLTQSQMDALTLFLFEEGYKEYELILVYTYNRFYTDKKLLFSVFSDLIDESHFHLKSFARMMSKMGLLTIPRTLSKRVYLFDDLKQFLLDGIKEEEAAKEECLKLAAAVEHEDLRQFFEFINFQENYHITLMEKALDCIEEKR